MKKWFNSHQSSVASPGGNQWHLTVSSLDPATNCKNFYFEAAWIVLHPEPGLSFSPFPLTAVSCSLLHPKHMQHCCSMSWIRFEGQLWTSPPPWRVAQFSRVLPAPARAFQMWATSSKRLKEKPIWVYIYMVSDLIYSCTFSYTYSYTSKIIHPSYTSMINRALGNLI